VTTKTIEQRVSQLSGEFVAAPATDVPFAPGFNLEALKAVDPDPWFATVKVKPGRGNGGKGPNYGADVMRSLEKQINEKRPPGYRGHQDPDKIEYEWREPVTAWVGAHYNEAEQILYVKGYVPPTAPELRQQLALAASGADVVNSVSVWGMRSVKDDEVVSYDLWSLDWTPKGRAGMVTELVGVSGEQRQEEELDRNEVIASLKVDELPEALLAQAKAPVQTELDRHVDAMARLRAALSIGEDAELDMVVAKVSELVVSDETEELEERITEKVAAAISGELMKAAVTERLVSRLKPGATDEEIAGEIESAKELPHISVLGGQSVPTVIGTGAAKPGSEQRQGTTWSD
jgi:hypothetical protein